MAISGSVFAEPALTIPDIEVGTVDLEADEVVAAMSLADKLASQLVKETTELNVGAALLSDDPYIILTLLALILTVAIVVLAAALEIRGCYSGLRLVIEATGADLRYEVGRSGLILAEAKETLCLHEVGIGETVVRNVVIRGAIITAEDLILDEAIALEGIATGVVNGVELLGVDERLAVNKNLAAVLSILLTTSPAEVETLVAILIDIKELREDNATTSGPTFEVPTSTAGIVDPEVGHIVATRVLILQGNAEDNLR